jgi:hypothetical protein
MKVRSIQFRFKSPAVTNSTPANQSLFVNIDKTSTTQFAVVLEHTSSLVSGSHQGSIPSPYSKYGTLKFIHEEIGASASVYLPFLDEGWWSVMVTQEDAFKYTLYAANKAYDGVDGNTLGFSMTSSFTGSEDFNDVADVYFPGSGTATALGTSYIPFDGALQELRYFTGTVTPQQFDAYTQNPNSIEGFDSLQFRASLGGELFKGSSSIHPGIGTQNETNSFSTGSGFTITGGGFNTNYETVLVDQVLGGIKNRVSDKIKKANLVLPTTSTLFSNIPSNKVLSSGLRIQQNLEVSQSSTRDINYAEVALSPQNEINDDINASFGFFNIGDYIGETSEVNNDTRNYPTLQTLSNKYFTKYNNSYDYRDYIRLAKYYDNAVFQMVKDFVPVRTGLATGVVVKQHLLERNRVRPAQVTLRDETLTGSIKPQSRNFEKGKIQVVNAGAGGSVNSLTGSNQTWISSYATPLGLATQVEASQYEFFNGEYSGSNIPAKISHSINETPILNNVSDSRASTYYQDVDYSNSALRPVNIDLILSSSALPATVPDSNYTTTRITNPRYLGSKNTGEINLSESFAKNSIQEGYPVDSQTAWFAHYNGIYNSNELGYQVGGNMNVTSLINAETSQIIELNNDNLNLEFLGQLFKKGDTPAIIPLTNTTTDAVIQNAIEFEQVGALYQTVLARTGSDGSSRGSLAINNPLVSTAFEGLAVSQSILGSDTIISAYEFPSTYEKGWIAWLGGDYINNPTRSDVVSFQPDFGLQIWDTAKNDYTDGYGTPSTVTPPNTLLPLQAGDFIRVGTIITGIDNVDNATTALSRLVPITSVVTASFGHLVIEGNIGTDFHDGFRIIRKVPTENYMLVKKQPKGFTGEGLVLPRNFNPKYNARQIANDLNIIRTT